MLIILHYAKSTDPWNSENLTNADRNGGNGLDHNHGNHASLNGAGTERAMGRQTGKQLVEIKAEKK